jgi:cobalt-zinc-cadmium efflux system membrane fusion protein
MTDATPRCVLQAAFLAALLVWLVGCGGASERDEGGASPTAHAAKGPGAPDGPGEERVRIDPETLAEFGIEVATVGPGRIEQIVSLPGEVRPNQNRLAHIAPRFPGLVREVRADIGDAVQAGQTLAVIESESLAPYPLKTLLDGVVIAKHITLGEPVSAETEAFVVADLRDVWIDISVYQKDLPLLRTGQAVVVSAGHGLHEAEGRISYIAPVVDEETRTATARVVLPNPERLWRPGLFVTARVQAGQLEVPVAVPTSALQRMGDETVVFVQAGEDFVPRDVEVGRRGESVVEILSGLAPGERYAAQGGFTLVAELSREELSGGHGH